jgi:EmrB/QacA subfamily drug resistance transporter
MERVDVSESELPPASADRRLRVLIPVVVAFCFFLEGLDSTIVATAIPQIARDLHETPLRLGLAITAYILAQAVFIPVSGWVADRFGMRRTFCVAMLVFACSSMACGLAQSFPALVLARVVQGIGGAMMTPVGRLILLRSFARKDLAMAISYMNIPSVIGPTLGPLAGGVITQYAHWSWIFFVNVPFSLLGIAMAWRYVRDGEPEAPGRFDWSGFGLVGLGMLLLQLALEALSHPVVSRFVAVPLLAGSVGALALYARHARGRTNAALDLSQLKVRTFRVALLVGGVSRVGVNAAPFLLPLMLQLGLGMDALKSGSLTFVMALGTLVSRSFSVQLLRGVGFRSLLSVNSAVCGVAVAGFVFLGAGTASWTIMLYVLVFGAVRNMQFNTLQTLTYADIATTGYSRATSLGSGIQQLTMGLGVSVAAMLLSVVAADPAHLALSDFHIVFLLASVFPLLAIPGFLGLRRDDAVLVSGHRPRVA